MKKIKALLLASCIFLSACSTAEPENTDTEQNVHTVELNYEITYTASVECSPIDKTLDCEKILLERADALNRMIYDYLNHDKSKLVFSTEKIQNATYRVISEDIKTYADFKDLFSPMIHEQYIDYINSDSPSLYDMDGELRFEKSLSEPIGLNEAWYLGYEVTDYSIIGHFALLFNKTESDLSSEEFLNNEDNYTFYDIIVHNIDGEYLLTDCFSPTEPPYGSIRFQYASRHGMFYNSGETDRTLITNEKVKPKID